MWLTGVSIKNTSYENIRISSVRVDTYWNVSGADKLISRDRWLPPNELCYPPGVGETSMSIASQRLGNNQYYAYVFISVLSESNRWGTLTGITK